MKSLFSSAIIMVALAGCANLSRQADYIISKPPANIPLFKQLDRVPFVRQSAGYCGPATLTMAMQAAGQPLTVEELAPEVYTPGKKGSLQQDMVGATRRHGMLAVGLDNLQDVLSEVANGHPVVVLQNLGLGWFPRWHYSLVTGYDIRGQDIILHSGRYAFRHSDMRRFEFSWKLADYWAMVILPPGELSTVATELAHVTAAAGLEQAGKLVEAERAYQTILVRWPESFASLIGLGNVSYKLGKTSAAVTALRRATALDPQSTIARHNLTVAENALRMNR